MKKLRNLLIVKLIEYIAIIVCMLLMWKGNITGIIPIIIVLFILGMCYNAYLIVYVLHFIKDSKK